MVLVVAVVVVVVVLLLVVVVVAIVGTTTKVLVGAQGCWNNYDMMDGHVVMIMIAAVIAMYVYI